MTAGSDPGIAPRGGASRRRFAVAAALLPVLLWLILLPRFGALQSNDYYWVFGSVVASTQDVVGPLDLLRIRSNEHHVVLPALLYFANFAVTDGDNRGLSLLAILLLAAEILLLVRLLRPEHARGRTQAAALGLGVGVVIATPAVAHCVVLGFSGAIWCLAAFLVVAAVSGLVWSVEQRPGRVPWSALVPAALASLANTSALAVWPALLVGAALYRMRWRHVLLVAACGAGAVGSYLASYRPMAAHPDPNTSDPALLAGHAAAVLGSPLAGSWALAAAVGGLGVGAALVLAAVAVRAARKEASGREAGWVMVALWSVLTVVGIAVGRSGFGLEQALQSRYATVSAPVWVALVGLLWTLRRERATAWRRVAVALALVMAVATVVRGRPVLRAYLDRAAMQPLAAQALRLGADDPRVLRFLTPAVPQLERFRPYLEALGHVPFDRPPDLLRGQVVEATAEDGPPPLEGRAVRATQVDERFARVEGWIGEDTARLVAVAPDGRVVAHLVKVPRLVNGPRWAPGRTGWAGYVRLARGPRRLRVVDLDSGGAIEKPLRVPPRRTGDREGRKAAGGQRPDSRGR